MMECSTALKMSKLQLGGEKMDDSHKIILTNTQAKTYQQKPSGYSYLHKILLWCCKAVNMEKFNSHGHCHP